MTKYYVGYTQGNGEYVFVTGVDSTVRVTTILEGAIKFDDIKLAEALKDVASSLVANQEYKVLEITIDIKEAK